MAKPDRDALLGEGEATLRASGIGADAPVSQLAARIGETAAVDLAVAHRLGATASEECVAPLRRLETSAGEKLVRKEAKRALYRLQQRGVSVPEPPREPPVKVFTAEIQGYLSPVDGRGDQLIWLVRPRSGALLHLFAVVNDPEGMREANLAAITKKGLRSLRAELEKKHELRLVEADWRYCDFLMQRAFRWSRERQARVEGDYPSLRSQILSEPPPEEARPPLVASFFDLAEDASDPDRLARSGDLLEEPEFRTWLLDPDLLDPYLKELESIKDSPIVLDRAQKEERYRSVRDRAVVELFGGERRESWVRRIYEMAYFFWATGRQEQARTAAAVAATLEKSERGGRDIPLLEAVARGSLALLFEEILEKEAEREKESLVLTPAQLRARREHRSG
jgi:hypothetical protein